MAVSLELLTDDAILDYTRSNGEDHVIYDWHDVELMKTSSIHCTQGGIYDPVTFGSPIADRCVCGKIRTPTPYPCPNCGTRVFSKEEALRRFGRIELPFYYLNELRFDVFKSLFDDIFKDSTIDLKFSGNLKAGGYSSDRAGRKLGIKVFDSCQFEYDGKKKILTITEFITDLDKCSYEGLYSIINEHFPSRLPEYRQLINKYYLVLPSIMRPPRVSRVNGKAKMNVPGLSQWYSLVVRLCCGDCEVGKKNFNTVLDSIDDVGVKARYIAILRAFLNSGKKIATNLLNSSKENFAREVYAVRTKNSARCPIVPSTTLPIDELGVPRHIAYEMCREGFMKYLVDELNFTPKQAETSVKEESDNEELQKLFKEYAEKQIVLGLYDDRGLMVR